MAPIDRTPKLPIVIGWAIAILCLAASLWTGNDTLKDSRRRLLLAECEAAARLLRRPDGADRVAHLLPGRWARFAITRPDLSVAQITDGEAGLVGHAPVLDASGKNAGTVSVLERRDVPRRLPSWLPWVSLGAVAVLLVISAMTARFRRPVALRWIAAIVIVTPAALTWHWTRTETGRVENERTTVARIAREAPEGDATGGGSPGGPPARSAGALIAGTLGNGLVGAAAWVGLSVFASSRRGRRTL